MQIIEITDQLQAQSDFSSMALAKLAKTQQLIVIQFQDVEQPDSLMELLNQFDSVIKRDGNQVTGIIQLSALKPFTSRLLQFFPHLDQQIEQLVNRHQIMWQTNKTTFNLTDKPMIYGILNTSPDSFYDGGEYHDMATVMNRVAEMVSAGIDVVELGGQTTRPGFTPITAEVEIERLLPYLTAIQTQYPKLTIAVDTYKFDVMKAVVDAGADIINDVNGFTDDERKVKLMVESNVGLLTMHSSRDQEYDNLTVEMKQFFSDNLDVLVRAGVGRERIALDQGVGYAKVADGYQDYAMMRSIDELNEFNRPIMVAISRKGFGAKLFGLAKQDRLGVTLIAETYMYLHGGRILRVHDIEATQQLVKMIDTITQSYWTRGNDQ